METSIEVSWLQRRYRILYEAFIQDDDHVHLRINLGLGWIPRDRRKSVEKLSLLLKTTRYHVVIDDELRDFGVISIRQDLIFRDGDLVEGDVRMLCNAVVEILKTASQLNWFLNLRLPKSVCPYSMNQFEVSHRDLSQLNLKQFVEEKIDANEVYKYRYAMVWTAKAIGDWELVLRLLTDYEEPLPRRGFMRLRIYSLVQLDRFSEAICAAEANGIRDGRFPKCQYLSPSYLLALMGAGDHAKAANLLGGSKFDEPDIFNWLRGLAHKALGDQQQADKFFDEYFDFWPGDTLGICDK